MAAEALALELEFNTENAPTVRSGRSRLRPVRATRTPEGEWASALLELPARMIGDLPVPVRLRLRAADGATFLVTPGSSSSEGDEGIVLDRDEWAAVVLAAEADRLWPADLVHALRRRGAAGRLSQEGLLDGVGFEQASRDLPEAGLTVGRVLRRIGARLERVSIAEAGAEESVAESADEGAPREAA